MSFMLPLSIFYEKKNKNYLINNSGKIITLYQVVKLFGDAFKRAATIDDAFSEFRASAIIFQITCLSQHKPQIGLSNLIIQEHLHPKLNLPHLEYLAPNVYIKNHTQQIRGLLKMLIFHYVKYFQCQKQVTQDSLKGKSERRKQWY